MPCIDEFFFFLYFIFSYTVPIRPFFFFRLNVDIWQKCARHRPRGYINFTREWLVKTRLFFLLRSCSKASVYTNHGRPAVTFARRFPSSFFHFSRRVSTKTQINIDYPPRDTHNDRIIFGGTSNIYALSSVRLVVVFGTCTLPMISFASADDRGLECVRDSRRTR